MTIAIFNGAMRLIAVGVVFYALHQVALPWMERHQVEIVVRPFPLQAPPPRTEWRT